MRIISFFVYCNGYDYVKRSCDLLCNEIFLRYLDLSWSQIIQEKQFCTKLFDASIYRFSYTNEELNAIICNLEEQIITKTQYAIMREWRKKVGKIYHC